MTNTSQTGKSRSTTSNLKAIAVLSVGFLFTTGAQGQTPAPAAPPDALRQLNTAIEALVQRVSPSVVQILVVGYGSSEDGDRSQASVVIGKQRTTGSGVIVDPDGYIVTNAHVVSGAQKIEVVVPPPAVTGARVDDDPVVGREHGYDARVVGISKELDIAVIKIEAHHLSALGITRSALPRQGEVVFAFGSPEGLPNSVTMGVVSAVARQPDPDSPRVFVQTDTPINPGNSGGPLVDADGALVGINTFILSSSGGNQGLGFAIPAGIVAFAYPQLVKYGHIHQPEIGAIIQSITPELASALHLAKDYGLIVSDVTPSGSADQAGLKPQDIIVGVDGRRTDTLPLLSQSLYMHSSGERAKLEILRGTEILHLEVALVDRPHKTDSLVDTVDPKKNIVRPLGIVAVELNLELARTLPDLRIPTGVIVAAKTLGIAGGDIPLQTGDVIHALNGTQVTTLAGLRESLAKLKSGDAVGLQVERYGQLIFVAFLL